LFLAALAGRLGDSAEARERLSASVAGQACAGLDAVSLLAMAREVACVALTGGLAVCPPAALGWGPSGAWTVIGVGRGTAGMPMPDVLALEDFREQQRRGAADLYYCLPATGTAWICARGRAPQPAQPQLLRVITVLAEHDEVNVGVAKDAAIGVGSLPAALDTAVSRCRRLLSALGLSDVLHRHGSALSLRGVTITGLVSPTGRRPYIRVRRPSRDVKYVGWVGSPGSRPGDR